MTNEKLTEKLNLSPIPESKPLAGWKEIPIQETELSNEPLVPVGIFSDYDNILSSSVYADEHHNSPYKGSLEGSEVAVFMREGVADRLNDASKLLPRGKYIMVMDAYRSLEVQGSLYAQYQDGLKQEHPDWSDDELSAETRKYVSIPSSDPSRPAPHNTGASVDVVIVEVEDEAQRAIEDIDSKLSSLNADDWQNEYLLQMKKNEILRRNVKMLDFGTQFDYGGSEAALRYLELQAENRELTEAEKASLNNRRLLYSVMIKAGFEPYADEWWHYNDPASQMGAKVAGRDYAEYGAAELSQENREFAQMREGHHHNSTRLARGEEWTPTEGLEVHYKLARAAVLGNNPRNLWNMSTTVAKIEPPKDDKAA